MKYYLVLTLFLQIGEEFYTCNNPNLIGKQNIHILCDWDRDDFVKLRDGSKVLRPVRKKDNLAKAYYRKKYWDNRRKGK